MRHAIKWQVSLSDGKTFFEGKGDFAEIEGALSPWQRLLSYLAQNKARITSLGLYSEDGRVWNLPSGGNRPKFQAFEQAEKPISFNCFRKLGMDVLPVDGQVDTRDERHDLFTVAQAELADGFLEIWVNERDPRASWTLFLKK